MLSGSVQLLRLSALRCSEGWDELCSSSGTCGWLTCFLLSVCEMVWRAVVLAAIGAMEQGEKRLWSLVRTTLRQGSAVQQAIAKASTYFWSALHDFARHDRPVPAKGCPALRD
jgi:hypothetical protein